MNEWDWWSNLREKIVECRVVAPGYWGNGGDNKVSQYHTTQFAPLDYCWSGTIDSHLRGWSLIPGKGAIFFIVSISKRLSLFCNQHGKYKMTCGLPLTSSFQLDYHDKHKYYIHGLVKHRVNVFYIQLSISFVVEKRNSRNDIKGEVKRLNVKKETICSHKLILTLINGSKICHNCQGNKQNKYLVKLVTIAPRVTKLDHYPV